MLKQVKVVEWREGPRQSHIMCGCPEWDRQGSPQCIGACDEEFHFLRTSKCQLLDSIEKKMKMRHQNLLLRCRICRKICSTVVLSCPEKRGGCCGICGPLSPVRPLLQSPPDRAPESACHVVDFGPARGNLPSTFADFHTPEETSCKSNANLKLDFYRWKALMLLLMLRFEGSGCEMR